MLRRGVLFRLGWGRFGVPRKTGENRGRNVSIAGVVDGNNLTCVYVPSL